MDIQTAAAYIPLGSVVGYTYGAFDVLHPGHTRLLRRAKSLCDFLIVGVVADGPIKDLKGKDRPVNSLADRLEVVSELRCVDIAIEQPLYDPSNELRALARIDILVKGDDWDYIPGTATIQYMGGKLIKLPYSQGWSSSQTIKRMGLTDGK